MHLIVTNFISFDLEQFIFTTYSVKEGHITVYLRGAEQIIMEGRSQKDFDQLRRQLKSVQEIF